MFGRQPPKVGPVGGLKAIVETGKPRKAHPSVYLDEPLPVLVDLGAFYPLPPFRNAAPVADGLGLRRVVAGRLSIWALSADGEWLGLVAYDVAGADDCGLPQRVSHWLPARVLKAREDP
jgi:hypothetical protein